MIYANVSAANERVPVIVCPIRVEVHPYDEATAPTGATYLVALSVLDDRLYLALDSVEIEGPEDPDAEAKAALGTTSRWWRTVRLDSPDHRGWHYGPAPISGSPSILDGDDLVRTCAAYGADLDVIDFVLGRIAQHRWEAWNPLVAPSPPRADAMVSFQVPLFPAITHGTPIEVDVADDGTVQGTASVEPEPEGA